MDELTNLDEIQVPSDCNKIVIGRFTDPGFGMRLFMKLYLDSGNAKEIHTRAINYGQVTKFYSQLVGWKLTESSEFLVVWNRESR